jgi:hypothetical protein
LTLEKPKTRIMAKSDNEFYTQKANRIAIKHHLGKTLAIIEIVSPGNKDSSSFVKKTVEFLRAGVHVLVIDLFPPTTRDPQGIHQLIWEDLTGQSFRLDSKEERTLASYQSFVEFTTYMETPTVGSKLPAMPLFIFEEYHVNVPLEETYLSSWQACPKDVRKLLEV